MKKAKVEIDTVTLPDGNRFTGYRGDAPLEEIRRLCTYRELPLLESWFLSRSSDIGCVYDIGANIGNHTVYFATHSKANIFSFEPMPVTFDLLKKNVEQNRLGDRVKLFPCALGAEDSSAKMQEVSNNLMESRICEGGTQDVAVKRLDDMNLPPPDFVKIDVEGYELYVLKGMERTLRESSPVLWVEIHADAETAPEIYQFLSSLGYLPVDFGGVLVADFLFTKQDVSAQKKVEQFYAVVIKAEQSLVQRYKKQIQSVKDNYENRLSWKITAPIRAIRSIFK